MTVPFIKMHGLGNDFVVIDARRAPFEASPSLVRAIADRRRGVGCDQFIVIEAPQDDAAQAAMTIRNSDGSVAEACGNGARCVGALLLAQRDAKSVRIDSPAGPIDCFAGRGRLVSVDMGAPSDDWQTIPLAAACDTLHLPVEHGSLADPVGVGMGNPHAVFFHPEPDRVDLETVGPILEHHPFFPNRANIEVCRVSGVNRLRMRVWERGSGITQACGSGACAAAVAAHRRGLTDRKVEVVLDGGTLTIEWREDGRVLMTGATAISFHGTLSPDLLREASA